ncbi:hypothetical protein Bca52824_014778 [Brassica carinata]|uniref:Uncharacterized protein n=1 Tax=Brassica carinata TaxID=52824 RepID=A0A8X8B3R8_BRACI|nr:hypothetical protein Bca52824_014778 [Brassica carinata]
MRSGGRRILLGFKETPKEATSPSNALLQVLAFLAIPPKRCYIYSLNSIENLLYCSVMVSDLYEKEKYRCSETGYRIPFKCREVRGVEASHKKDAEETPQNAQSNNVNDDGDEEVVDASSVKQRNLRDDSTPASKAKKSQSYKTYRSCVPSADEERVSVLGFEAVMLGLLLVSGSAVYYRKKQTLPMAGVSTGRSQSNSRF